MAAPDTSLGARTASMEARLPEALKDAAIAAVLALGLFAFMLGIRTVDAPGELLLAARPGLLFGAVAVVFVGRLLLNLFIWNRPETADSLAKLGDSVAAGGRVQHGVAGDWDGRAAQDSGVHGQGA